MALNDRSEYTSDPAADYIGGHIQPCAAPAPVQQQPYSLDNISYRMVFAAYIAGSFSLTY